MRRKAMNGYAPFLNIFFKQFTDPPIKRWIAPWLIGTNFFKCIDSSIF